MVFGKALKGALRRSLAESCFPADRRPGSRAKFDRAMPERLFHTGQIHVAGHQVGRQAVLEAVGVPFLGWQASSGRNCLEKAKERRAIESAAFLRREEGI